MLALLLFTACATQSDHQPAAEGGVLDLTAWEPSAGDTVRLEGEWRYYPRQLLSPGDADLAAPAPALTPIPDTWSRNADLPELRAGHGFATYALTVRLPPGSRRLALRMITVSTAFRLFANGALVAEAGEVARDASDARPEYRPQVSALPAPQDGTLELVLQASNFHYARGGPWEPIWIGDWEAIRSAREQRIALALFLAGSFAIIGLYHLVLWGARRNDRSPLYFAVICLGMALRGLTVEEVFLTDLLPGVAWSTLVRLEYGSLLIIVAATPLFLYELFPREQPRRLILFYTFSALLGLLAVSVLPPDLFSRGLALLQALCVSAAVIGSILVARSLARRREGAALFLIGLSAIALTGIHDVLVSIFRSLPTSHWLVTTIYLQPFGLFVFVLSQAVLLSRRSSHAFTELQETSKELQAAHAALDARARKLEERVAGRTAELEQANLLLAELSEIDSVTSIGNRRFFEDELRRAWFDQLRRKTPLSLLLVDIDHFKAYNDHHGHLAGDHLLRAVAGAVERCARRPTDTVARYGGDELVVLLPNTPLEGASRLAGMIRESLESAAIPHRALEVAPYVTVSIGVATLVPQGDVERSELVAAANRALYSAKQAGRNRVIAA